MTCNLDFSGDFLKSVKQGCSVADKLQTKHLPKTAFFRPILRFEGSPVLPGI
jgi:hypothetical protein